MPTTSQALAYKINYIRTVTSEASYSQFANKISAIVKHPVSRGALIRWEYGQTVPHLNSLIAISKIGSISLDDLLSPQPQFRHDKIPELTLTIDNVTTELPQKLVQIKNHPKQRTTTAFSHTLNQHYNYQISSTRLTYWLKGVHTPNALCLYPLAHIVGLTVDELLFHPYPLDLTNH